MEYGAARPASPAAKSTIVSIEFSSAVEETVQASFPGEQFVFPLKA